MTLTITPELMGRIHLHGEQQYPEEGAGLMLGSFEGSERVVTRILPMDNEFDSEQRTRRYQIDPKALLLAEEEAEAAGLIVLGAFHSHPDHPPEPSEFDLNWAVPWYVYLITSVVNGEAGDSRVWLLQDDHSEMHEESLKIDGGEQ